MATLPVAATNADHAAPGDWDPVADLSPVQITVPASAPDGKPTTALVFLCRFPGCGRQFQLKGNLKRHQNIHSGDKQFRCDFCGRSFLRKADMEVHLRVHTGEKPYECKHSGCGKRFARRSDLLSHERTHSGNKPFACEFPGCGRRFARRFDLHKHERAHDEDADGTRAAATKKPTMKRRLTANANANTKRSVAAPGDHSHDDQDDTTTQDDDDDGAGEVIDDDDKREKTRLVPQRTPVIRTSAPALARATASGFAPISPTDHANGPGKDFHFELKCTEDHIHTSPECFSMEELDALLGPAAPGTACCPEHLQSIAEAFATAHAHAHTHDSFHQSMGVVDSYPHPHAGGRIPCYTASSRSPPLSVELPGSTSQLHLQPQPFQLDSHAPPSQSLKPAPAPSLPTTPVSSSSRSATDAMTSQMSSASLNSPCPVATAAKLHDYAAHTSCGHLAIQHGDHRDFVVKNHLVCVDNVKSLSGDCGGAHASAYAKPKQGLAPPATKCAPQDPHRPGCGHLAVRHGDHIDYVVEDNLFCQLAGGLMEDAGTGNIELLDDDFWDFYGAIGSLKTE